jgi:uncharacterized SAM-binding protein YcdF (DUF218 family)
MRFPLTKKHTARRLTWQGWLFVAFLLIASFLTFISALYPFLAPDKQPKSGLIIVEGWIHDRALDEAVALYRSGAYTKIACTGVPIETGSYLQPFKSFPEMTAARLRKLGIPDGKIIIACATEGTKDRTYQSAVALHAILTANQRPEKNLHLITVGPHGRRSRMLFQKALGKEYDIGVTCLEDCAYSPASWYTCSEGVRAVIGEFIAYTYARLFFHP